MKKFVWKAVRISLASLLAMLTATVFHLEYAVTAGIITVLTIQNTKKETFLTARNRAVAFLCALAIAGLCYQLFGFQLLSFTIYLFLFALLCLKAGWTEAIAMDSVLISHFLAQQTFDSFWVWNEVGLFCIGTLFGIIINLTLRIETRKFEQCAKQVDEKMKAVLYQMQEALRQTDRKVDMSHSLSVLDGMIQQAKMTAWNNWNNSLVNQDTYEMDYIRMRENQSRMLKGMNQSIGRIQRLPKQSKEIADFINKTAEEYHRENDVTQLLTELEMIQKHMKEERLPVTREEFEARAVLFYLLNQLEDFLSIKRDFCKEVKNKIV